MSNTTRESPGLTPDLPALIAGLPADRRARFERIFNVELVEGELRVPDTMREWTISRFGAIEDVEHQQIVRITNKVTWEGAIFNPLRARRPMRFRDEQDRRLDVAEDIFADPARMTTEDTYGRVSGDYCITTSNIARWDAQCSVLIFQEPDPLAFTRAHLRDYFRTALRWADAAHRADPEARFMAWMWNGGTAGGASIPHAHAQMGLGKHTPYPLVEGLRRAAVAYGAQYGADYFADLATAHADVGLGFRLAGLDAFLSLTPTRMKDTWILGAGLDDALADAVHDALRALIDRAGVRGFDVGVVMPPLYAHPGDVWEGFPVIARILDRGRPDALSSDIGAMDFFGARIIADDPYLTRALLPF